MNNISYSYKPLGTLLSRNNDEFYIIFYEFYSGGCYGFVFKGTGQVRAMGKVIK